MASFIKSNMTNTISKPPHNSSFLPTLKQIKKLHSNPLSMPSSKLPNRRSQLRNSSNIDRPSNPIINDEEFSRKCNNLWTKFDNRVSPILKKYKFSVSKKTEEKSSPFRNSEEQQKKTCCEESNIFGIQYETSSDGSDDVKVCLSNYVDYISLGF